MEVVGLNKKQRRWFLEVLKGLVKKPDEVGFKIGTGLFGLDIVLVVAPLDEERFTTEVIEALKILVRNVTGEELPMIHFEGKEAYTLRELVQFM